jgi:hypothetical protein
VARSVDKKNSANAGCSVTGVAGAAPTHALFQAHGVAPVPTSTAGMAQAAWGVLGTGMKPDLRILGVEAV